MGEGINGSPVVAPLTCPQGGEGLKIGVTPDAGWRELVALLRYLWQNNALMWLPPVGAAAATAGGAA